MVELTELEKKLIRHVRFNEYCEGGHGGGWTFAVIDNSKIPASSARGVLSSLVKKGLIYIDIGDGGIVNGKLDLNTVCDMTDLGESVCNELGIIGAVEGRDDRD